MAYSEKIKKRLCEYLNGEHWPYTFDEELEAFRSGIRLKGALTRCDLVIHVQTNCYAVYAIPDLSADQNNLPAVAEFLHRANYNLRYGSFELDLRDGEIQYKMLVDCGDDCDCLPSDSVIARSLLIPANAIEDHCNGLLGVLLGLMTPEEAIQKSEAE